MYSRYALIREIVRHGWKRTRCPHFIPNIPHQRLTLAVSLWRRQGCVHVDIPPLASYLGSGLLAICVCRVRISVICLPLLLRLAPEELE